MFDSLLAVHQEEDAVVREQGKDGEEAAPEQQAGLFEGVGQREDASAQERDEDVREGLVHACSGVAACVTGVRCGQGGRHWDNGS